MSSNNKVKRECPYGEIEEEQVRKLLGDRIEFKLWAAQRHLEKLNEIENAYEGIAGKYKIYAEDELDCFFAQIIGARDSLLILINDELVLGLKSGKLI
jgi:hypothetical protein